jgi:hypothetical protein
MAQRIVPLTVVWNYGIMGTSDVKPRSRQNRYTAIEYNLNTMKDMQYVYLLLS